MFVYNCICINAIFCVWLEFPIAELCAAAAVIVVVSVVVVATSLCIGLLLEWSVKKSFGIMSVQSNLMCVPLLPIEM